MSKQSEAKKAQGYTKSPVNCATCVHFKFENVKVDHWRGTDYFKEKNLRCGIGGFAVQRSAHCSLYEPSDPEPAP